MAKIELRDAYFHVSIHPSHHRYLRFVVGELHFQYIALPFGLSTSPRVFSKCVVVITAHLRLKGVQIFQFLDDWLLLAPSESCLHDQLHLTRELLTSLGLMVNTEKSSLTPVYRFLYIGAILDSLSSMAFLPLDKARTLSSLAAQVRSSPMSSALQVQCLLCHMAAAIIMVPYARRHMQPVRLWFLRNFRIGIDNQSKPLAAAHCVRDSLCWWTLVQNLTLSVPFLQPQPQLKLTTDASLWGWRAQLNASCVGGPWPALLCNRHINYLKLLAILLALREFQPALQGKVVQVFSDNTTAVCYLNKQGRTVSQSLCQ